MSVLHGGTLQIEPGFFFFLFLLLFFFLIILPCAFWSTEQSHQRRETHSKERGLGCVLSIFQTNLFDPKAPQIAFSISGCTATSQIKSPVGKPADQNTWAVHQEAVGLHISGLRSQRPFANITLAVYMCSVECRTFQSGAPFTSRITKHQGTQQCHVLYEALLVVDANLWSFHPLHRHKWFLLQYLQVEKWQGSDQVHTTVPEIPANLVSLHRYLIPRASIPHYIPHYLYISLNLLLPTIILYININVS